MGYNWRLFANRAVSPGNRGKYFYLNPSLYIRQSGSEKKIAQCTTQVCQVKCALVRDFYVDLCLDVNVSVQTSVPIWEERLRIL